MCECVCVCVCVCGVCVCVREREIECACVRGLLPDPNPGSPKYFRVSGRVSG